MKKKFLASLSAAVLLLTLCFSGSPVFASTLSASTHWTMGSGWVDYSNSSTIIFENSSDTASPNFNNTLIDGSQGFKISFKTTFLDPAVQTTAGITLRLNSNTTKYFSLRVTGKGTAAMLQVDYCDSGSWISVIPYTGEVSGANGSVVITVEREAGTDAVSFSLKTTDGTVLFTQKVSNTAFDSNAFLDKNDLEFIVFPYQGYGLFRFSDYSTAAYPNDGIDDPLDASTEWSMGSGWTDSSTSKSIIFSNVSDSSGPNFRIKKIDSTQNFKLSFTTTVKAPTQTTEDITLRLTTNNSVYMRILATGNSGSANVDVNFFNGQSWTSLSTSGWREGAGSSFVTTIEHQAGSNDILFTLSKTNDTVLFTTTINNPVITNSNFFSVSDIEALVVPFRVTVCLPFPISMYPSRLIRRANGQWNGMEEFIFL